MLNQEIDILHMNIDLLIQSMRHCYYENPNAIHKETISVVAYTSSV